MVGRLAPRPAAVQCAAARPPLTSHVPARSRLGRGPGDHAQDPPAPRRRLGGDSDAPCLRVFQMPFTELHQRPDSFPPHVICLCHQKMPTESYFAFPPSILCFFKRRRKKKSWRRDALTWVKVSRELRISKKQIFSKLLPRMSQCDLFIIFLKKRALGKRRSGEYLKPEAFTALNGVSAGRVMALLESFPCALRSPYLTSSSVRGFLHVRYSYIL